MSYRREEIELLTPAPGTRQSLVFHRFGRPGAGPKAYIQASIHADEIPAMMAAHHLLGLLAEADKGGLITGEIVLVPYANPIGLAQWVDDGHSGRHELRGGGNFNRNWLNLEEAVITAVEGKLGQDPKENVALIRSALLDAVKARRQRHTLDSLRCSLMAESVTADYVLDLHCDDEALLHLYTLPQHWDEIQDLGTELGVDVILVDEGSAGGAFDECNSHPWVTLQRRFPDHPIPLACFATTVELRGEADVSDSLGREDAGALFRYLVRRGVIAGAQSEPPTFSIKPTQIDACAVLRAPAAGILAYQVELGQRVEAGQVIAELVDPAAAPGAERQAIRAEAPGLFFARRAGKLVLAHHPIGKIAGDEPLSAELAYSGED